PYAEPHGSEVPPVGDESTATAYDAQLARDEDVQPVDATPAPEPTWAPEATQAEDTASFDDAPVTDEHHPAWSAEQVPPVDRPAASDDHDREPPR
ncbi:MAG TPA: hypothetical protein VM428_10105, partial [Microlunatus sp.]|nr:hypothetical protein [Microlunatus sp.]